MGCAKGLGFKAVSFEAHMTSSLARSSGSSFLAFWKVIVEATCTAFRIPTKSVQPCWTDEDQKETTNNAGHALCDPEEDCSAHCWTSTSFLIIENSDHSRLDENRNYLRTLGVDQTFVASGEAYFCAPAFSYVVRTKKGPFFVILARGLWQERLLAITTRRRMARERGGA